MRISRIEIENLRAIKKAAIDVDDYTCILGRNSAGKSTVLCALNIFFRNIDGVSTDLHQLEQEDFFGGDTSEPIKIRVTFTDISADATDVFRHYVRGGKLVITALAKYDAGTKRAPVVHYGERFAMAEFRAFFEAFSEGKPAAELAQIYEELQTKFADLPTARSKEAKAEALREFEGARPDQCVLIPSEDQFYGVSKGANKLEKFVQWVYVPAVKDATSEQIDARNSALSRLLARAVRAKSNFDQELIDLRNDVLERYSEILKKNQAALADISRTLEGRLSTWSHEGTNLKIEWQEDEQKSVKIEQPMAAVKIREDAFEGGLDRVGHGVQRSFIIALLQELAMYDREDSPRLILAIEEPELYQHPPQARYLASVLHDLSKSNSQVFMTSHSPYFVSGQTFENVRLMRKNSHYQAEVYSATSSAVSEEIGRCLGARWDPPTAAVARLQQVLQPQISEIFFADRLLLVEGLEDLAFIRAYLGLKGYWDALRSKGFHIVHANGKSEILRPLVIAQSLQIPTFLIFDCDSNTQEKWRAYHERDNMSLLRARGLERYGPFVGDDLYENGCIAWKNCFSDAIQASVPEDVWRACREQADAEFEHGSSLGKNVLHIARLVEKVWEAGVRPEPLEKVSEALLGFVVPV